jgi:uncharacterized protein (DUF433 family)
MSAVVKPTESWQTSVAYSIPQAAKIAGTHPINVRRWLYGSHYTHTQMKPVFGEREEIPRLSFIDLAEIIVVTRFRQKGVKLNTLRDAYEFSKKLLSIEYPFAHMNLKTDGANVLATFEEDHPKASLMAMNKHGQLTLPQEVINALELFDYEREFAARWFPVGRDVPIVVDPRYSAGQPSIPYRRLPITILYYRWKGGEPMGYIASDYSLPKNVVEEALRYAEKYVI